MYSFEYRWHHTPTGHTGVRTFEAYSLETALALINHWNASGEAWRYVMLPATPPPAGTYTFPKESK